MQLKSLRIPRSRRRRILGLGLPIVGAMVSNALMTLIDTAMVGVLGNTALAAVGLSSFTSYIYLALFNGLAIAVQAAASRRKGEGKVEECGAYLNTALLMVILFAPISSVLLWWWTPTFFPYLNSDPSVIANGIPYLQWLLLQGFFVGFINAFNGFWNAIDLSRMYMGALIVSHASNILFNYIFIFGNFGMPAMGVEGAGFGTFLAALVGSLIYLFLGLRYGIKYGFLVKRPTWLHVRTLTKLAIPAGLQQVLDVAALTLMYRIVGMVGTMELAVYTVLINLVSLLGLPGFGFGTAGATLVGQALGRQKIEEAHRWAMDVLKLGVLGMACIGAPFWLVPDLLIGIWIHDPATIELGRLPMQILGFMIMINGIGYMMASILNGAGDVNRVMYVNFVSQWFWLLPGAYFFGPYLGFGLIGIWCMHQFGYRALQSGIFLWIWQQRGWAKIKF